MKTKFVDEFKINNMTMDELIEELIEHYGSDLRVEYNWKDIKLYYGTLEKLKDIVRIDSALLEFCTVPTKVEIKCYIVETGETECCAKIYVK